ncbi:MAG: hypothetical protein Sapg2KO_08800 [Saprospiraceae bacterium]
MKVIFSLSISLILLSNCDRDPNKIYEAVLGEIPISVHVLNAQDQYVSDCCIWLHFEISKNDLRKIIVDFEEQEIKLWKWKSNNPPNMDWWKPDLMEGEILYFERRSTDFEVTEGIYTNDKFNEVYYVNSAGF